MTAAIAPTSCRMLTPEDEAILDLERTWWTEPALKDHAIRDRLGISRSQYYRRLGALLDEGAAYAYDPLTISRLRRRRTRRRKSRFEGRTMGPMPR